MLWIVARVDPDRPMLDAVVAGLEQDEEDTYTVVLYNSDIYLYSVYKNNSYTIRFIRDQLKEILYLFLT